MGYGERKREERKSESEGRNCQWNVATRVLFPRPPLASSMATVSGQQLGIDGGLDTTNRILLTVVDELVQQRTAIQDLVTHLRSTAAAAAATLNSEEPRATGGTSHMGELKDILKTQTDYLRRQSECLDTLQQQALQGTYLTQADVQWHA